MSHLGDFDASTVVYGKFTTYQPSTGAAFTLGGTPALSVYKDNSTTQSTTGVTLTASFDSVTGLNHFAIDTSADGTFYSAGSFFDIVITTGTVDSVSVVGSVVGSFTLRKSSALKPTTAARTLDVSAGGEAGIDWANIGSPTTAVNLSATNIDVDQVVASVSGAVASVTGAVGSVTGNVGGNVTGSVGSVATGGITAASFAADAITAAKVAADVGTEIGTAVWATAARTLTANTNLNDLSAAGVRAAVGLASANLDTQIATLATATALDTVDNFLDTEIAAIKAVTDQLPNGGALTSLATQASVNTIDDFLDTEIAAIVSAIGTPAGASLSADVAAVKVQTTAIETDTQDIQTRLPAALVSGRMSSDIEAVNDVAIQGAGTEADPWRPA